VYISEIVVAEAAAGDGDAARRRAEWMEGVPSLSISDEATALAGVLVQAARLPHRAAVDALHIAVAACHGMHYLLTWNSTHIAKRRVPPQGRERLPRQRLRTTRSVYA
jgi:predicted nucleic acid-binding protein